MEIVLHLMKTLTFNSFIIISYWNSFSMQNIVLIVLYKFSSDIYYLMGYQNVIPLVPFLSVSLYT